MSDTVLGMLGVTPLGSLPGPAAAHGKRVTQPVPSGSPEIEALLKPPAAGDAAHCLSQPAQPAAGDAKARALSGAPPSAGGERRPPSAPAEGPKGKAADGPRSDLVEGLEPLLQAALDATLASQPAEADLLRHFTRSLAMHAYGGQASIDAQEARLPKSALSGEGVDAYLARIRPVLENAVAEAVGLYAAEMPAGAFLDSTNAWPRLVPFFETVFMRTAGPESAEERKRREDIDATLLLERERQNEATELARQQAARLASKMIVYDEQGSLDIARELSSSSSRAHLAAVRRCRVAIDSGSPSAQAVREALLHKRLVPRLVMFARRREDGSDEGLGREAAWLLALVASSGEDGLKAVAAEAASGALDALVALLRVRAGDGGDDAPAASMRALGPISRSSVMARDALLDRGVLPPLLARVRSPACSSSLRNGVRLLSSLVLGKPKAATSALGDAFPVLAQLLGHQDDLIARDACSAISSALNGNDGDVRAVLGAAPDAPRKLVELLQRACGVAPELRESFDRYDRNRSGALSRRELRAALKDVGIDLDRAGALSVMRRYDADSSGTLSLGEFAALAAELGLSPAQGVRAELRPLTLRAISSIVACEADLTQTIVDCGGLDALCSLVGTTDDGASRGEVLLALSNVAAGTAEQVAALERTGAFEAVAREMARGSDTFNREAAWTISNATASGSTSTVLAIARGSRSVEALLELLPAADAGMTEVVLDGLERFLKAGATEVHPEVRRVFESHDANGDGALSRRELSTVLRGLSLDVTRPEAAAVLRRFDADGDGTLSLAEFGQLAVQLGAPVVLDPISSRFREGGGERAIRAVAQKHGAEERDGATDAVAERCARLLQLC